MSPEDERAKAPNACRATTELGGHSFICIKPVHAPEWKPGDPTPSQYDRHGRAAKWRRHYFVRQYPYSDH